MSDPWTSASKGQPVQPAVVPNILVPDASVAVKWFLPEPDTGEATRLLEDPYELHAPSYLFTEAASVLQRKVALERVLSESEGLDVYRHLQTVPMTVHSTEDLIEGALLHGIRYRRPVYDSLYLVLAATIRGRVVTADRRLYRGVRNGPLQGLVLWVADPL